MIRNTVVFIIAVLALGVLSTPSVLAISLRKNASSSTMAMLTSPVSSVSTQVATTSSIVTSSVSASLPGRSSSSVSSSLTSMVTPTSSIMQSVTASPTPSLSYSSSPTPSLSQSSSIISSSSIMPNVTSSAASFITPSRTDHVTTQTIHLKDKNQNASCLYAKFEVNFMIQYNSTNSTNVTTSRTANIPLNGFGDTINTTGNCSFTTGQAYFQIVWSEYGPQHTFRMDFQYANKKWNVPNVNAKFNTSDTHFQNPDAKNITANVNASTYFGLRSNNSNYVCNAGEELKLSDDVKVHFKNLILQPFSHKAKPVSNGYHCSADKTDDDDDDNTVPIAVGAALGGLVLIVLVAYIIGRRRSNRGYEQV